MRQIGQSTPQDMTACLAKMPLVEVTYRRRSKAEKVQLREVFNMEIRQRFLQALAQRYRQVPHDCGLTERNLAAMARGHVPHGYQVHHILPLDDGGTNDFANLVLIRAHPEHETIHRYLDPQIQGLHIGESRRVRLPRVDPGIYQVNSADPAPGRTPVMIQALRAHAARHQR